MKKITIAIDGFSSCGKSTMAKDLAREIGYIYENKPRKSLIRKFLYNQEYNLEQKEAACDEIREDIVNEVNRKNIISKINRYNNRLDKLLYNINREFGIM